MKGRHDAVAQWLELRFSKREVAGSNLGPVRTSEKFLPDANLPRVMLTHYLVWIELGGGQLDLLKCVEPARVRLNHELG